MATTRTTITLSEEAFKLLKKFKAPGDTYSDVILEHMDRPPARTAGELLKRLDEIEGLPIVNPELMAKVRAGRGRQSNRKARRAR